MQGQFFLYPYQEGQIVTMKKNHPCGGKKWKLLRVGAEVLMVCETCGHKMSMKRSALEKACTKVEESQDPQKI
ncbi:MAG: DUF951 domain-containing protein [Clostridiales bacterium]|nr:DUF951 domain-containing protein [Clostridiales bacterium]